MPDYTEKYHLKKPRPEEFADIADLNGNADIIDEALGKKADLDAEGKVQASQLPSLDYIPADEKGKPGGVATLDDKGKIPGKQIDLSADPAGTAASEVSAHNIDPAAHQDIRDMAATAQESAEQALKVVADMAYTINMVPSQAGSLSYTGSAQSPSWVNYDPKMLTLGGTTSGTNAGTYTATFTPKGDYHWADGSKTAVSVSWTIGRAAISAVPSQSGSLTYTGSSLTPSWSGYDTAKMTLGGTTSGTNAGSYNATFTPKANYRWSDGSTGAKTVSWSIGKAAGSLSLSPTSLSITGSSGATKTISVTRAGNGAVSASSNNTGVATVSVSGTTVTVTLKGTGSATITVSVAAGTNHNAPSSKTCSVTGSIISTTLASNSWATIAAVSAAGNASSFWSVGDEKTITVNGETLTLVILGFNHDDLASGGKAGITFGLKHLMTDTRQMNSSNTNSGGFTGSAMYTWLQNTLLGQLPSDLKNVIKSVNKKTSAGDASSTINTSAMKLFLFSEQEIFGSKTYSTGSEGTQYSYFATAANRIKKLQNGAGSAKWWWERSPYASNSDNFCDVYSNGSASSSGANNSGGVCFGFCV